MSYGWEHFPLLGTCNICWEHVILLGTCKIFWEHVIFAGNMSYLLGTCHLAGFLYHICRKHVSYLQRTCILFDGLALVIFCTEEFSFLICSSSDDIFRRRFCYILSP
ncbi:hypothetical protein M6B38_396805 [Iris pallida]|uniref:Uncharacterized protein n=1 Tax=Iris pallida TaxID=29817 RepID=A0AAX6FVG0_IRIPA|nr:hypothetical protein M6B38_396805 [Iris pallida]